jgi:hypothetical protein
MQRSCAHAKMYARLESGRGRTLASLHPPRLTRRTGRAVAKPSKKPPNLACVNPSQYKSVQASTSEYNQQKQFLSHPLSTKAQTGFDQLDWVGRQPQNPRVEQLNSMKKVVLCLLLAFGALLTGARQDLPPATNLPTKEVTSPKPADPSKAIESSITALTNTPVRMVEPGVFQIGKIRLDQRRRSVTFPAVLNRAGGLMEYFLVTTYGKTHESILKTQAEPYHIHLAMLLLGADGPGNAEFPGSPANGVPGPVVHPSKDIIPGNKVAISVKWNAPGGDVVHSAEELIYKQDAQAVMEHGSWVYNGSLIVHNKFLAQMDGSIISLVTDPVALINNTGPGHDNDLIWEPNPGNLPPPDLPVEVTITFQDPPPKP